MRNLRITKSTKVIIEINIEQYFPSINDIRIIEIYMWRRFLSKRFNLQCNVFYIMLSYNEFDSLRE